jgi:hypothetical protein
MELVVGRDLNTLRVKVIHGFAQEFPLAWTLDGAPADLSGSTFVIRLEGHPIGWRRSQGT